MTSVSEFGKPLVLAILFSPLTAYSAEQSEPTWSQFRGPNCSGIAATATKIPIEFGTDSNVAWKTPLPKGLSSPCVWNEHLFVTAFDDQQQNLLVVCLNTVDGSTRWQKTVRAQSIEKVHKISSPATGTPVADGERVYVYFGSSGLFCFDFDGNEVWKHEMPVATRINGSGTSPVLADELVLLNREDDREKYLLALNRVTGKVVWKQSHTSLLALFGARKPAMGEATPVIWKDQVVLHRMESVVGRRLSDGKLMWSVNAATTGCSTPVVVNDTVYVSAWNNFGEASLKPELPTFDALVEKNDRDSDGKLSRRELPGGLSVAVRPEIDRNFGGNMPLKMFFQLVDTNKDGGIDATEYARVPAVTDLMMSSQKHGLMAIGLEPGERQTKAKTLWREEQAVAEVPSPLHVDGRIYMVKNGGILSCFNAETGDRFYRERIGAPGPWYASPIAAGGRIFLASGSGTVVVIEPGDELKILARNTLGESIMATPAVAGDRLLIRTENHLYAFDDSGR